MLNLHNYSFVFYNHPIDDRALKVYKRRRKRRSSRQRADWASRISQIAEFCSYPTTATKYMHGPARFCLCATCRTFQRLWWGTQCVKRLVESVISGKVWPHKLNWTYFYYFFLFLVGAGSNCVSDEHLSSGTHVTRAYQTKVKLFRFYYLLDQVISIPCRLKIQICSKIGLQSPDPEPLPMLPYLKIR